MATGSDPRRRFPDAREDHKTAEHVPDTPQTVSPTYRLAFSDAAFLTREELRPVRLQLELLKTEMALAERGIVSTIVMFGGARIPAPERRAAARTPVLADLARYYAEAEAFARLATTRSLAAGCRENVICTGGGPGVMEAGNKGAAEAGGVSISLNIVLPHEQVPNLWGTPELSFNFHYFAVRKMHFLMRAKAIAVFPGGFGTLDELLEVLTLVQTQRLKPMPILLFGRGFWERIIDWQALEAAGTISPGDLGLFRYVETAAEAWELIERWESPAPPG
ncbi:TIGR00730 family Rossman fold protein [soil metagenome]